jgi:anthranilate/para-aminobenzoate synthase component II
VYNLTDNILNQLLLLMLHSLDQYVKLDSAAADAVTLLPDPSFPHQHGSIYDILNKCKTKVRHSTVNGLHSCIAQ